jgi:RimJ/RimL family protein N-acetyltransferase
MRFEPVEKIDKQGRRVLLRSPELSDAPALIDYLKTTSGETPFLLPEPDEISMTPELEGQFLQEKTDSDNGIEILAEVDGMVAGLAGFDAVGGREKIRHRADFGISVDRQYWNLGIGTALMNACIECAEAAGYEQIELSVVAENEPAIAIYKKAGFVEYGRNPRGFKSRFTGYQELVYMRMEL